MKGINEWIHNWIKYNWRTSKGMVLNRDSWEKFVFHWQSGTQGTVEAKRLSILGSGATKELIEKCKLQYKK